MDNLDAGGQSLEFSARKIIAQHHRRRPAAFDEAVDDRIPHPLHARRADLHRQHVVETIDDETRQAIAFPIDKPAIGSQPRDSRSARARSQTILNEGLVESAVDLLAHHARADERVGIHIGAPQGLTGVGEHVHAIAGLERREGAAVDCHLVAEHPGMPALHTAFLAAAKIQTGEAHGCSW